MKKNNMFRKGMILGIIVLFVGASVVPSISGNIKNNSGVKDELNVNVGYQKSVEPDSHMIQLSSRELPDTVYVYNNRSDPFDSNAIGYIWQQLGLLTENGQPGVVQGDNVVDPDNPNTVLGTVIRDGNGQVIGYRSNDGTQEAYVVNEGATTAQAWNRTAVNGTFHIIKHGAIYGDNGTIRHGGGIMLDDDEIFDGFGEEGSGSSGTGANFTDAGGWKNGPYELPGRPGANITVKLNSCYSSNDPDGNGSVKAVNETAETVGGVGKVEGHEEETHTHVGTEFDGPADEVSQAISDLNNAARQAGFIGGASQWIASLPFAERYNIIIGVINNPNVNVKLNYSKSEMGAVGSYYHVPMMFPSPEHGGATTLSWGDALQAGIEMLPGSLTISTIFQIEQVPEIPTPLPQKRQLASGIFDFHSNVDETTFNGPFYVTLRYYGDYEESLEVFQLDEDTWNLVEGVTSIDPVNHTITVETSIPGICAVLEKWHVYPGDSIQDAIDNASSGDTIYVHDSNGSSYVYHENVNVNKPDLRLIGDGRETVIVEAVDYGDHTIHLTEHGINITGFMVTGADTYGYGGICIQGADYCKISNCSCRDNLYAGIFLKNSGNCEIKDSIVSDNGCSGIEIKNSHHNTIKNNFVERNVNVGLDLYQGSSDNLIYNNYFNNVPPEYGYRRNVIDRTPWVNTWNIEKISGTNIVGGPYLGGNYYADYTGCSDIDGDRIGDIPYEIRNYPDEYITNMDYLPLIIPGDLNHDGDVDLSDLAELLAAAASNAPAERRTGNYLIITASAYNGGAPLTQFVAAKRAQGYEVTVYSVPSGTSRTVIKDYIASLWGTPAAPKFVLLVGDTDGSNSTSTTIPHWTGGGSKHAPTDLPYGCMDGDDDWHPEISVGRFSVRSNSALQDVVNKSLYVEGGAYPDPDYPMRGAFLANPSTYGMAEPTHDWVIDNYFVPNGYEGIRIYSSQGGNTQDVTNAVNDGCLWAVYYGHSGSNGWWDPFFGQGNVQALSNAGLYGVVFSFSCDVGAYHYDECFGETWQRVADRGAAAVIFPSDKLYWGSQEAWMPSTVLEHSFFRAFFEDDIWEVGPAWQAGLYHFENEYDGSTDVKRNFFEEYNLLGDPSLALPHTPNPMHVSPPDDLLSEGPQGGPFTPDSIVYALSNGADYAINYEVTSDGAAWVTLSGDLAGTLSPGGNAQVLVEINSYAEGLGVGGYNDTVYFTNLNDHVGDTTRNVVLAIGVPEPQYSWNFNTNPGWSTEGLWAFGDPTGGGGQYGGPDPQNGHTGSYVYGYNLNGDYENNMPERHLTTTAIDCSDLTRVSLKFWRWLGVEQPAYDHASLKVSNDGTDWETIWSNSNEVTDYSWQLQEFDIAAIANNQPTVYLRWTMGTTDSSWRYCGWNIDDVEIWGIQNASCPGDLDGDGDVDLSDLAQLLSNYGTQSGATYEDGDIDGDGDVDLSDLAALLANYGTGT